MANTSISAAYRRNALLTSKKITDVEVPSEVLEARENFAAFCTFFGKPPAKHMLEWHNAFITGESSPVLMDMAGPNTAILAPRGSAKSTCLGMLAAWMIGRHAQAGKMLRILYLAYMTDVSRAKSATIKALVGDAKYRQVFPKVRLSKIKRSDEYWSIDYDFAGIDTAGEEAFTIACGGLRGAITSKRSQLIIIDDPIKDAEAAHSQSQTEALREWYASTFFTRREGNAPIVVIQTRWSQADLVGWLLEKEKDSEFPEGWHLMNLPALAEPAPEDMPKLVSNTSLEVPPLPLLETVKLSDGVSWGKAKVLGRRDQATLRR